MGGRSRGGRDRACGVGSDGPPHTPLRLIPGGEFIMGTDGDYGFAADGEGPAHKVVLAPFHIDATCVTNEQFNAFVNATRYQTEAERFGWSFVFQGHLTPQQQESAVRLRVLGSEVYGPPTMSVVAFVLAVLILIGLYRFVRRSGSS